MTNRISPAICTALVVLLGAVCTSSSEDSRKWLDDFEHLKSELATGYANLEWIAKHNNIDLAAHAAETEEKLRGTGSERKARKIIEEFLKAFGDPHLRAKKSDPPEYNASSGGTWTGPPASSSAKDALEAFGYSKGKYNFGIDFESLDGFDVTTLEDNPFPTGVLTLDDGRKLGVIRIKYFGDDRYYNSAEIVWNEFQPTIEEENCNGDCWWKYTLQARERLMRHLQTSVEQIQEAGAGAIVVDITGNGGGSEWCEDVARLFSAKRLRPRDGSFIKHPHSAQRITGDIESIDADLARDDLPTEMRTMLEVSRAQHEKLLAAVQTPCDATSLWDARTSGLECQRLMVDPHGQYQKDGFDPEIVASLHAEHILFDNIRHPDYVGVYDGPLFVAIDGGTASASEQFATLLDYNKVATLVGETTYGAGCGYTSGGIKVYLENTKLRVWMSDCVRMRADGENELAGVEPHIKGWDEGDKGKTRAEKTVAAIAESNSW